MPSLYVATDGHYFVVEGYSIHDDLTAEGSPGPNTWQVSAAGAEWLHDVLPGLFDMIPYQGLEISESLVRDLTKRKHLERIDGTKRKTKEEMSLERLRKDLGEMALLRQILRTIEGNDVLPRSTKVRKRRKKTRAFVTCEMCQAKVREVNLARHQKTVHKKKSEKPVTPPPVENRESKTPNGQLVQCNFCNSLVREDRLQKHRKRLHGDK